MEIGLHHETVGTKLQNMYSYDGTTITWLPPPLGVRKQTSTLKGQWERRVYQHLQKHGYPTILQSWQSQGHDTVILHLNFVVTSLSLAPRSRNMEIVAPERRKAVSVLISGLLRLLAQMHNLEVLHGDIHPSNVGWLINREADQQMVPVFLDFGRAIYRASPPPAFPDLPAHHYSPDDFLLVGAGERRTYVERHLSLNFLTSRLAAYTSRDDVESLAFTILHLVYGVCPWADPEETCPRPGDFIVQLRNQTLTTWGRAQTLPLEMVALQFVEYARRLTPEDKIEYNFWANKFEQQAMAEGEGKHGVKDWLADWGCWVIGVVVFGVVVHVARHSRT